MNPLRAPSVLGWIISWLTSMGRVAASQYTKHAELAALEGDYYAAVTSYEKAADLRLQSVPRYSAKDEWLRAGLCALATGDLVTAQRNVQGYFQRDPQFESDRQGQLLLGLIEAIGAGDQEAFTHKISVYDPLRKLSAWEAEILVRIKHQIEEADNEFA